ncbi:MAG TPA: TonB family protein, partial [Opitutaceae bacterium]|nr:TonB family protein [Opitutaceae bacterium]
GMRGLAVVEFIVDENGHTRNLVARKATDVAFAEAAKIALSQWVFLPAKKGGVPVACRMQVPMVFSITED